MIVSKWILYAAMCVAIIAFVRADDPKPVNSTGTPEELTSSLGSKPPIKGGNNNDHVPVGKGDCFTTHFITEDCARCSVILQSEVVGSKVNQDEHGCSGGKDGEHGSGDHKDCKGKDGDHGGQPKKPDDGKGGDHKKDDDHKKSELPTPKKI